MFPRDWKHFKKLLIKINIVLVIHATMNSGRTNLNCEAFCSACANISKSNHRPSLGALRKTIRFYIVNLFERLNEHSTLCFASHNHIKSSTFSTPVSVVWLFDETLPLVFNLLPERVQSYHWRIVITICFYKAFSLCSFLDCCSLVPE